MKNFIKSVEAIIVFGGLLLIWIFGDIFIPITALAYLVVNIPNAWNWITGGKVEQKTVNPTIKPPKSKKQ